MILLLFSSCKPSIGNFAAIPDSFLGLKISCSDPGPYDNFNLFCTTNKPALMIPALEVVWLCNDIKHKM